MTRRMTLPAKGVDNPLGLSYLLYCYWDISFDMKAGSETVINAVDKVLKPVIVQENIDDCQKSAGKIFGAEAIGDEVLKFI